MYDPVNNIEIPVTHDMLLVALKQVKQDKKARIPGSGICFSVKNIICIQNGIRCSTFAKDEELLTELMTQWPKFSGHKEFPIKSPDVKNPMKEYLKCPNKWGRNTVYGRLRWELLDWLINKLENENDSDREM